MAAFISQNLASATITYNGVQFGGGDARYKSAPPQYAMRGDMVYDDAGRAVKYVQYTLTVKCIFYEETEAAMASNADEIRRALSSPGQQLAIVGLGIGFGILTADLSWGPKPISCEWQALGEACWEIVWTVQFRVSECMSGNTHRLTWTSFNYDQTWQNDFEGFTTRTITGHIEIAGQRNPGARNRSVFTAEQARQFLGIALPNNFKRVANIWKESPDKTRIDFVVIDEQLRGDPLPAGVTMGDGYCDFDSMGPGFNQARVSLGMTIKTSPNVARGTAGFIFMQTLLAKQFLMSQRLAASKGTCIPERISIRNRKWEDARITECSASWMITKCLNAMLNASGIWEPLSTSNYNQWRASMSSLWGNRGNANMAANANEDVIIDICQTVGSHTIGTTPVGSSGGNLNAGFQLGCPDIPPDGGWIVYDVNVQLYREDAQTTHKQAVSPAYQFVQQIANTAGSFLGIPLGLPPYNQSPTEAHFTEYHGFPEQLVLLQFRGLRFKHDPVMPTLTSIAGKPARHWKSSPSAVKVAFDVFGCPVKYVSGWRLYRVDGYIGNMRKQGRPDSCAEPIYSPNM